MALDIHNTRNVFLQTMCGIFLCAFLSLYLQIRGLYGPEGVLPAHLKLGQHSTLVSCLSDQRSLVCLAPDLDLSVQHAMELTALAGVLLAAAGMVFLTLCRSLLFLALCVCYLSLHGLGQTFLYFQWDSLLMETGWLCVVAAPIISSPRHHRSPHTPVTFWLVRWLLFRLMFASGVVKLQSNCPTWWGLSALTVHYESQCLPGPLSWFAHHLPVWFHQLCVVSTYVVEIAMPLLFFSPVRMHRIIAFYGQLLLQVSIIFTGNYNFFNLLTVALCFSLIDDKHLGFRHVKDMSLGFLSLLKSCVSWVVGWLAVGAMAYYTVHLFDLRLDTTAYLVNSKIAFSTAQFERWLANAVPASVGLGCFSLAVTATEALCAAIFEPRGVIRKASSLLTTVGYCAVAALLFAVSLVPYSSLDRATSTRVMPHLGPLYRVSDPYQLTGSYGLFRRMTGVGGRPELQLEGSEALSGPWLEYQFRYKPGSVEELPSVVAPHQPRLDWQMWFAALGSSPQNPWLLSLAYRLLQGQDNVIRLLHPASAWVDKPPKYIRATKYIYTYTKPGMRNSAWWERADEGEYLPVFSVDHAPLVQYLTQLGLVGGPDPFPCNNTYLCPALDALYDQHKHHDPVWLMYGVLGCLALGMFFGREMGRGKSSRAYWVARGEGKRLGGVSGRQPLQQQGGAKAKRGGSQQQTVRRRH